MSKLALAVVWLVMLAISGTGLGQDRATIIRQSYEEAFGRAAQDAEVNYWQGRADWQNKDQLMAFHLIGLRGNGDLQHAAVTAAFYGNGMAVLNQDVMNHWKAELGRNPRPVARLTGDIRTWYVTRMQQIEESYKTALGRSASTDESKYWIGRVDWANATAMVELHRQYIRANATVQDEIIRLSYQDVFNRAPNEGEWGFWRPQMRNGFTYQQIEAAHRDWQARNRQRLLNTPALVQALNNKQLTIDAYGSLVGQDGASVAPAGTWLVGQDGASLIGHDGATIVAAGGGN